MTTTAARNRGMNRLGLVVAATAAVFSLMAGIARAEGPSADATKEADTVWQTRCTTCHGADGKGDGPAAVALTPKPRELSNAAWQASVTDEHLEKVIVGGGQAVGLSMMMTANPDLASKPEVVKALVAHIRGLVAK